MPAKALLASLLVLAALALRAQQKGYYSSPAISGNTVVFRAEGDLWKYDLAGGAAARLTSDVGVETDPAISPDGRRMVFLGQYEGVTEIYLMDLAGGNPRRLTWHFDRSRLSLCGWTPDGQILYSTSRYSTLPSPQLVKLSPETGEETRIPLAEAAWGCYGPEGALYFTRLPDQGSKTKRYKGGFIQQIWKFDGVHEAVNLTTDYDGISRNPMACGDRIYFLSDRDGTINLWSMNAEGKDAKQHTFSKGWDIHSASISGNRIVYRKGADLGLYDIASNQDKILDIALVSDFDQRKPKWIRSPVGSVTSTAVSPSGNYVALLSRGRIFVSPAKSDRWVEISRKSGVRFRDLAFLDEKTLAVLSDESGEFEVWTLRADGSGQGRRITQGSATQIAGFAPSPDGKYVAYGDKNDVLRIVDIATGTERFKYAEFARGLNGFSWSPDSRYLAFGRGLANGVSQIAVVDVRTMTMSPVTTPRLESFDPAWSFDNKWLYFISERNLTTRVHSPWGPRQPEPYYTQTRLIYAMPLDTGLHFPFAQTDAWLTDSVYKTATPVAAKPAKKSAVQPAARAVDWAGASAMLYTVPLKSGNLRGLTASKDGYLYWIDRGEGNDDKNKLFSLKIAESRKYEPVEIAEDVADYALSGDGKKIFVSLNNKSMAVADANGAKIDLVKSKLQLDNWMFQVDPVADWKQIFDDAWRMERDYFYDRHLHGVDWAAMKAKYETLIVRVADRDELNDLIADMMGEISVLHTFVGGGDLRRSDLALNAGFLGADLRKTAQGVLVAHIYRSDPDYPDNASPLAGPTSRIREGHTIVSVNNISLKDVHDPAELLVGKIDQPVKLGLVDDRGRAYDEVVRPIGSRKEFELQYGEWELTRRERVDSAGAGAIGYVHLQSMVDDDMDAFVRQYYPVFDRQGLILDVRDNNGGNIDSWVLEKLMRKAWMYWQGRAGLPTWNMQFAFRGKMVILCNQKTASDGEAVTEGFRRLGLGRVIGMRTWGGEVWLSGDNVEVDNGIATAAEIGVYGPEGKWLIEGRGVEPDISIDNLPFETFRGKDTQLDYAIDYLKKEIARDPNPVPKVPAYPEKAMKDSR